MRKKVIFMFVFSSFLLSMCKTYANESTVYPNGLTCDDYTGYSFFQRRGEEFNFYIHEEGADCAYTCSNGMVRQADISGAVSPLYSASQAELEAEFCGVALESTPTEAPSTESPTQALSPTVEASPTTAASPTSAKSPTPLASPVTSATAQTAATTANTSAALASLLTGRVTMCDTGGNLISFRITQPPPDLTGKQLTAQIDDRQSTCYVNDVNPSIMTCALPPGTLFPASIVVSVDGQVASEFSYNGLGCTEITTPVVTTTP